MLRDALPIDAVLPELIAKLRESGAVVLQAPTGAGKTTRVPPALIDGKQILLLEPRRVAARAAARRMAIENGTALGDRFGYHVRFDKKASSQSKVIAVTPGILLRLLQEDPFLEHVGTILFDEFHERGLESDLALGMVKLLRATVRPDLRTVVMSATLDTHAIANYLGNCPIVASEGRSFPVTIRYQSRRDSPMLDAAVQAVRDVLHETQGDVLVFLPGLGEIRRAEDRLKDLDELILPLHGELAPEQQDRALQLQARRKIVLATNVAETSVTVDGVTAVIDTGQARQMEFDASIGMNRLRLAPVSKASADQRAGRAGRTQPGLCVRLWDEPGHRARREQTESEIRRVDLAPATLQLLALGEDVAEFPWIEAPRQNAVAQATALLERLDAVKNGTLTKLGKDMAALPVHPRLARMLLESPGKQTALAAAILSGRDPFDRESLRAMIPTHSDLLDRVEAIAEFERTGRTRFSLGDLHHGAVRQLLLSRDQLLRMLPSSGRGDDCAFAIYTAYADRLCRRREKNDRRAVMLGGRGVILASSSGVIEPDLFVAIDVDAGGTESLVRIASEVRREWLTNLVTKHEIDYDAAAEKIIARKRTRLDDLIIDDTAGHIADDIEAARVLAANLPFEKIRPAEGSAAQQFLTRLECLKQWRPDLDLPLVDLKALLPELCCNCRSMNDVKTADWLGTIRGSIPWKLLQAIDREVPESFVVPSGRAVALTYEIGRPPILAAKIQELFGMAETPRVAGHVKVLVHLLAPNGRPQQVTDDLASFWANTYSIVRKELRGRYPKHDWPEDPSLAIASRGVRRTS